MSRLPVIRVKQCRMMRAYPGMGVFGDEGSGHCGPFIGLAEQPVPRKLKCVDRAPIWPSTGPHPLGPDGARGPNFP